MEDDCVEVLERLVEEDDQSVEAWYLGGWCQFLMAQKASKNRGEEDGEAGGQTEREVRELLRDSREWLDNCLRLYESLEYEDERLMEHTKELVEGLEKVIGAEGDEKEDEWEDDEEEEDGENGEDDGEEGDEDEEMNGM